MKKIICKALAVSLFYLFIISQSTNAQVYIIENGVVSQVKTTPKVKTHYVTGRVVDASNSMPLGGEAAITLMNRDSTVLYQDSSIKYFSLTVPGSGDYIVRCTSPHYETLYKNVSVKFHKREYAVDLGVWTMFRSMEQKSWALPEVVVETTKLKFYFDKDTLIYDAQAFVTQEGFMLNEVLKKMPGLQVGDDGEIYSNGRKIDELLLNGKDFFDRNRKTILDNLPAFTLKSVKVYEKKKDAKAVLRREREFEGLVMDVRLKKQYEQFAFGNAGLGYGTGSRYQGSLFGLKYNPLYSVSAFVLANNINRKEAYHSNGSLDGTDGESGERIGNKAGLDYHIDHKYGYYALWGHVMAQYSDEMKRMLTDHLTFLNDGGIYQRMKDIDHRYTGKIETDHHIELYDKGNNKWLVQHSFSYEHFGEAHSNITGTFNADVAHCLGRLWVDSLAAEDAGYTLRQYGICREASHRKSLKEAVNGGLDVAYEYHIPHTEDILSLRASGSVQEATGDNYNHRWMSLTGQRTATDWRLNQYEREISMRKDLTLSASYSYIFSLESKLLLNFDHSEQYKKEENRLYRFNGPDGWTLGQIYPIDYLPNERTVNHVMDVNNSYQSRVTEHNNAASLKYEYHFKWRAHTFMLNVLLPLDMENKRLDYRSVNDTTLERNMISLNPAMEFKIEHNRDEKSLSLDLGYNLNHSMPVLLSLVNRTYDANPLYIVKGNPNLKNQVAHNFNGSVSYAPVRFFFTTLSLGHTYITNRVGDALWYIRETGVAVVRPCNVKGDRNTNLMMMTHLNVGRERAFSVSSMITCEWERANNYTSSSLAGPLFRNAIHHDNYSGNMGFSYSFHDSKYKAGGGLFIKYEHIDDRLQTFVAVNSCNYGFRANVSMELPRGIYFSSDMCCTCRSGYHYSSLNRDEIVWNASVKKSWGEHFTAEFVVKDVLNQRNCIYHFVNPGGGTEWEANCIKRYGMLHLVWRFGSDKKGA